MQKKQAFIKEKKIDTILDLTNTDPKSRKLSIPPDDLDFWTDKQVQNLVRATNTGKGGCQGGRINRCLNYRLDGGFLPKNLCRRRPPGAFDRYSPSADVA